MQAAHAAGYSPGNAYGHASAQTRALLADLQETYQLASVADWPIDALGIYCFVFSVPKGSVAADVAMRVAREPGVESAQPMYLHRTLMADRKDPYADLQSSVTDMQIHQAHALASGRGVTLAIIDSGVEASHPELAGRITESRDFVNGRQDKMPADVHGTAVAGIIASGRNNGIGIVGVAPDSRLLALKACWQETVASHQSVCSSFTLAQAIAYAIERRADIVNLSLNGPRDPLLERLVEKMLQQKMIVVCAAPENGNADSAFPAATPGVVAVASSPSSAWLAAPGVDVLTIVPPASYEFLSGNSLAAAHVSGVAALLLEHSPKLSVEALMVLLKSSERAPDNAPDGALLVNACEALVALTGRGNCLPARSHTAVAVEAVSGL